VQVWSCGAADGRMGIESSQLRSIKTSSKALGCCILIAANLQMSRQICKCRDKSANVATNLHIVAANMQTLPPVPELVNEPILKIGAV
jgi:hypothetical protein